MTIKFGPAGLGPIKTAEQVLEDYHKKGLRACEIAFTYSIYITNKEEAYGNIKNEIISMMHEIKKNNWKIKIAAETMGKVNVFGSLDEISKLVKDTSCSFCIDFAHILAREKKVDYEKVERLFPQKEW